MLQVLDYIDRPVSIKEDIFVREIKHSKASEIASKLNELIQDSQSEADASKDRIAPPTQQNQPRTPAGVIRARQAAAVAAQQTGAVSAGAGAAELAERGIIQGKVRIVADDRTGILFIISQPENFAFFDQIISVLDQAIDPSFEVRVLAMEYADAEEISGILNEFIGAASAEDEGGPTGADTGDADSPAGTRSQALRDFVRGRAAPVSSKKEGAEEASEFGQLSSETKIIADPRTNSIMLMGQKSDLLALEDLIDQLDIMLGQVLIEAVILEVLLDDGLSHGVDWLQRSFIVNNEEKVGPGGGVTVSQPVLGFGGGQNLSGRDSFIDGGTVGRDTPVASALSYYLSLYDLNLDAVITMAANSSDARILSTPVIMTADNTEAQINVGEERPVVSTSSTTDAGTIRSSYEYRNIGINLTVTPRINPERLVVMEITQTADDVGGEVQIDGNLVPIITKREFSAQVAVNNRETIVLGGLVRNSDRDSTTKVPILGDIPILGALFRSETSQEQRTELLVLITPYVLMTQDEVRSETERLHDATQLRRTGWERGWSDSKLAQDPKQKKFTNKAEKKIPASHRKKAKKYKPAEETSVEPKLSPNLVFADEMLDEEVAPSVKQTPEVILEIPAEPSPDDLVPMSAPAPDPVVEVLVLEDLPAEVVVAAEPLVDQSEPIEEAPIEVVSEAVLPDETQETEAVVEEEPVDAPVLTTVPAPTIRTLRERSSGPPMIPSP